MKDSKSKNIIMSGKYNYELLSENISLRNIIEDMQKVFFEYSERDKTIKIHIENQVEIYNVSKKSDTGYSKIKQSIHKNDIDKILGFYNEMKNGKQFIKSTVRLKNHKNIYLWYNLFMGGVFNESQQLVKIVGGMNTVEYIDVLTNSITKKKFQERVGIKIQNTHSNYALVNFDIDKFKVLNDIHGEEKGDILLKIISSTINSNIDSNELCSRYHDDRFGMFIEYIEKKEVNARVSAIIENIKCQFSQIVERNYNLILCTGIYFCSSDDDYSDIMIKCNYALKTAKRDLKDIVVYDNNIKKKMHKEQEIEDKMYDALKNRDFKLFLQPKYNMITERIEGAEALVRWKDSSDGNKMIYPNDFIHIFEKTGFIKTLDMYMLEGVCENIKNWMSKNIKIVPISVNFSRQHLSDLLFPEKLVEVVNRYGVDTRKIEIEFTEEVIFSDTVQLQKIIEKLHKYGFTVSMDDFGKGYSSLGLLKDVEFDILKLDKTFIEGCVVGEFSDIQEDRGKLIVSSIIQMAKSLNMKVIAEGVEYRKQVDVLVNLGCFIAQGYYYNKPMEPEELYKLLEIKQPES